MSKEEVSLDHQKVKVVESWVRPSLVSEVRSFVGLASYYHRLVKNFAAIATHLTNLTKTKVPFKWSRNVRGTSKSLNSFDHHAHCSIID